MGSPTKAVVESLVQEVGKNKAFGLSLDNFDEHKESGPYLTSPRSIEACLRHGVHPEELLVRYD